MDLDVTPARAVVAASASSTREELWRVISDPSLVPSLSSELADVRASESVELGSTFEGVNRRGDATWITTCTVTTFDPGASFGWTVGPLEHPGARWRLDIVNDGRGLGLEFTCELLGGPSGLTWAIEREPDRAEELVAGRLAEIEQNMRRTVEGLSSAAART